MSQKTLLEEEDVKNFHVTVHRPTFFFFLCRETWVLWVITCVILAGMVFLWVMKCELMHFWLEFSCSDLVIWKIKTPYNCLLNNFQYCCSSEGPAGCTNTG